MNSNRRGSRWERTAPAAAPPPVLALRRATQKARCLSGIVVWKRVRARSLGTTFPTINRTTPIGVGEAVKTCDCSGVRRADTEGAETGGCGKGLLAPPSVPTLQRSGFPSLSERLPPQPPPGVSSGSRFHCQPRGVQGGKKEPRCQ